MMEDLETNQTNRLIIVVSTNAYIKHPPNDSILVPAHKAISYIHSRHVCTLCHVCDHSLVVYVDRAFWQRQCGRRVTQSPDTLPTT